MADFIKILVTLLRFCEAIVAVLEAHLELSTGEKTKLKVRMYELRESIQPMIGGERDGG